MINQVEIQITYLIFDIDNIYDISPLSYIQNLPNGISKYEIENLKNNEHHGSFGFLKPSLLGCLHLQHHCHQHSGISRLHQNGGTLYPGITRHPWVSLKSGYPIPVCSMSPALLIEVLGIRVKYLVWMCVPVPCMGMHTRIACMGTPATKRLSYLLVVDTSP